MLFPNNHHILPQATFIPTVTTMAGVSVAAFQKLLATGRDSDFTIKCRGVSFKVHQLVMKSASPFFRAACEGEFKVSSLNVKTTGLIAY